MSTVPSAKTTKPDRLATRVAEILSVPSPSGSTPTFAELVAQLAGESDSEKISKSFTKNPLKGHWAVPIPKWDGSPIVRTDQLNNLARDPAFLVKLAEQACSAEQPEVPLAQIVKPVEKNLAKEMVAYWTENLNQFPIELQPIVTGTAKKKTVRVHLKRYPSPAEVLSNCLLSSLRTLRERDPDHYPATINEILSDEHPFTGFHEDAVNVEPFASRVICLFKPGKKGLEQLYGLLEDQEMLSGSPRILTTLWKKSQKASDDGVSLKELVKQVKALVDLRIAETFQQQIEEAVQHRRLPNGIASLKMGKDVILFETRNVVRTSTATVTNPANQIVPPSSTQESSNHFADEFEQAFDRLFKQAGSLRSVKLSDLRLQLTKYSREAFDRGLNDLRRQQKFTLESNEGQRTHLTSDEQEAGIVEGGQSLYFCRRK